MKTQKFKVREIKANPFRHIERYPIREEKVAALRESLRKTGWWGNVVCRLNGTGGPEIAYGHHRREALLREYGPDEEVSLIVRDLDDDAMLKIMARENMEEWGTSAAVEQETVRAVVEAYAEGKVELPDPDPSTNERYIRFAPNFGPARRGAGGSPYTAATVSTFLGWNEDKVQYALGALELIEAGILKESQFDGLGTKAARAVVTEARKAARRRETIAKGDDEEAARARREAGSAQSRKEREAAERRAREAEARAEARRKEAKRAASKVGRTVSKKLKSGSGYKQARDIAREADTDRPEPRPKRLNELAHRFAGKIAAILDPTKDMAKTLREMESYVDDLSPTVREEVVTSLRKVAERANRHADALDGKMKELPNG